MFYMGCKGIKSELNSTLFDCFVRNPTQKATPFSCDYLRNQMNSSLIMTYSACNKIKSDVLRIMVIFLPKDSSSL